MVLVVLKVEIEGSVVVVLVIVSSSSSSVDPIGVLVGVLVLVVGERVGGGMVVVEVVVFMVTAGLFTIRYLFPVSNYPSNVRTYENIHSEKKFDGFDVNPILRRY